MIGSYSHTEQNLRLSSSDVTKNLFQAQLIERNGIFQMAKKTSTPGPPNPFIRFRRRAITAAAHYAPERLRKKIEYWRVKRGVRHGMRLVEEGELKREYRRALLLLAEAGGADSIGDYLEFGVFYGSSLACMHDVLTDLGMDKTRLFGFDSFEGLPEIAKTDDGGVWRPGAYRSNYTFAKEFLTGRGVDWDRVILEKGWFRDTLNNEFIEKHDLTKASLIMIDCDIYSSAKKALDFCAPLIRDQAIILFDDWTAWHLDKRDMGEKRAFDEFLIENSHLTAEEFGNYQKNGKIFRVSSRAR